MNFDNYSKIISDALNLFKVFGVPPDSLQEIRPPYQGNPSYQPPFPPYQQPNSFQQNYYSPQFGHSGSDLSKRDFKNINQFYLGRIKNFLKKQI
jgi:hypothetical protein